MTEPWKPRSRNPVASTPAIGARYPGEYREGGPPLGGRCYITTNHASCGQHGHWVRHRATGQEGRIDCELPADGTVAVMWEDESHGWYRPQGLEELPHRERRPWHRRRVTLRRRPDGRDGALWWEDGPNSRWQQE